MRLLSHATSLSSAISMPLMPFFSVYPMLYLPPFPSISMVCFSKVRESVVSGVIGSLVSLHEEKSVRPATMNRVRILDRFFIVLVSVVVILGKNNKFIFNFKMLLCPPKKIDDNIVVWIFITIFAPWSVVFAVVESV